MSVSKPAAYVQALRMYSFAASIIPALYCIAAAAKDGAPLRPWEWPLLLLAAVSIHAATNMVNDYFDFRNGVDHSGTIGNSRVLVDGLLTGREILLAIAVCYLLALGCGTYFVLARHSLPVLIIGSLGILGSYAYTGKPFSLKYHALGEPVVFLLMGPLFFGAMYMALSGKWSNEVLLVSVAVGLHITAILTANNTRDIANDRSGGISTLATLLGKKPALRLLLALLLIPYALAAWAALAFNPWYFLAFFSVPMAWKLVFSGVIPDMTRAEADSDNRLIMRVVLLQTFFGALLLAGAVMGAILRVKFPWTA
jgi:1,4-dihydroxy-2-naphthoate octaprenyltransferase